MVRTTKPRAIASPDVSLVINSLRRVVRAFRAAAQEAEDALGISGAQHFVLQQLSAAPALSLNELAVRTMTHKSSVSVVVSRLVARGFVSRRPSAEDGRSIVVAITADGRRALARIPDSGQTRMIVALGRMGRRNVAHFSVLFEQFAKELGAEGLEPSMLFESEGLNDAASIHSGRRS